ncbi:MAG: radical SAM protein [Patescibacteria group bacterium]
MEENKQNIKELRERALSEHDRRSEEIYNWTKENGGEHHRVNRYATRVNAKTVGELIDAIQQELLEASRNPDSAILLHVFSYLQTYDFSNTDEAGRDTPGFSLAISELDVALRHLKLNPKNAMRYLVYRYKLKTYANNLIMLNFAPILYLESALSCNLMCVMCYQSDSALQSMIKESSAKHMKWDLFTKIIDEASALNCCAVVFAGRGEPTLNPRFSEMLKYCHEKGILDIKFNTNAMTMTEKMAREWLSMKTPLTIVFSVDAADKETFEKIRIGASFDKVVNNIKMFNRIRNDEFPDSPVRTRVSMTLFRNDQNPDKARELWASLVDEFSAKVALSEQSGSIYQNEQDGTLKNICPEEKCKELFTSFHIWSDGAVNPCENDYLSHLQVGSAQDESLSDLWNGLKMMKLRIAHMSGKKNSCYPCNGCSGY